MHRKQRIYNAIETVLGRDRAWKLGRFLYLGARRELGNDPCVNGEYALIGWMLTAIRSSAHLTQEKGNGRSLVFIDVGANVGEWTGQVLCLIEKHGLAGQARVEAVEPAPPLHRELARRFAADTAHGRVRLHAMALSAKLGVARFTLTGERSGTGSLSTGATPGDNEIDVEVITLDEMATRFGMADLPIIKIDTEGNDLNVIRGASGLLEQGRVMVMQFEYNWRWIAFGHWLRSVFQAFDGRRYALGLLTRDGIEVHERWHPELEHYHETNYAIVRRDILPLLPHRQVAFSHSNTLMST